MSRQIQAKTTGVGSSVAALVVIAVLLVPFISKTQENHAPVSYDEHFTGEALRVDLVHSGTLGKEFFGLDEIVVEPIWPGTRVHLIDPTGYGKYRFRVLSQATGKEIFTQGYCTLFGEWLTTAEAASGVFRSMSEPIRFPFPKAPVTLVLEVRDDTGDFIEIQKLRIDTTAYDLRRERTHDFEVLSLHGGKTSPSSTLDIVIVPDGYTAEEESKLVADARRFATVLAEHPPFSRHVSAISIRLVKAFSRESGPDEPRKGLFRDTIVDTTFDTFRSPRYLTTSNMKALREVAALAPYDTVFVMVNTNRYGGGGIFGSYSIFPSDSEYDEYVMVHEFGHGFGGLADEYYSSSTGYDEDAFYAKGTEPWEPNITAQKERDKIKWKDMLTPDVPIPTPDTDEYDNAVGLFEGAGYKSKGLFRATRDSKMFHKGLIPFGPINEAAIEQMIRYYTDSEKR
ncbi:MAG: peptidase M64 [Deltaproteobacteria bacterium]|nr:peptidase M64 [Deltaproteobacteria bacterium]